MIDFAFRFQLTSVTPNQDLRELDCYDLVVDLMEHCGCDLLLKVVTLH